MQVPKRKPGKYTGLKPDPHLTEEKYNELKDQLKRLQKIMPEAAEEVRRTAAMGDLSENAAYQVAKGRLRGINEKILELDNHLKHAVIIQLEKNSGTVQLGRTVTVEISGREQVFLILGSSETDPRQGVISHHSPLGSALMGHQAGDTVMVRLKDKELACRILRIV